MPDETHNGGQAPAGTQPQAGNVADPSSSSTSPAGHGQQGQQTPQAGNPGSSDTGQHSTTQSGAQSTQSDPQSPKQPSLEELLATKERLERELADTRKESANYRTKARDLDKRIADEEAAKLSDVERAQKRAEQAEQAIKTARERIGKSELKLAAKDAGIIDAEDAIVYLLGKIEYDDDGEPRDVSKLVEGLRTSKPHLFAAKSEANASGQQNAQQQPTNRQPASSGGATNPGRQGGALVVTPNQYMDKAFQATFKTQHGMDVYMALKAGKIQIA